MATFIKVGERHFVNLDHVVEVSFSETSTYASLLIFTAYGQKTVSVDNEQLVEDLWCELTDY